MKTLRSSLVKVCDSALSCKICCITLCILRILHITDVSKVTKILGSELHTQEEKITKIERG